MAIAAVAAGDPEEGERGIPGEEGAPGGSAEGPGPDGIVGPRPAAGARRAAVPRRHLQDELERLRRELADREAQLRDARGRVQEALGASARPFGALSEPRDSAAEVLTRTARLDAALWGDAVPAFFDPAETRLKVLEHVRHFTQAQRLEWLQHLTFLTTPQVLRLWRRLDKLRLPVRGKVHCLRVVGEQGSGKSWALQLYALRANRTQRQRPGDIPVLLLEAPVIGTGLTQMYREGLALMNEPTKGKDEVIEDRFCVKALERHIEMIVIDEAGNLDTARKLAGVRRLHNRLRIPIVAASAEGTWFGTDAHLGRRFRPLHGFGPHLGGDLVELLTIIDAYLPLPGDSDLFARDQMEGDQLVTGPGTYIARKTEGVIDRVVELVYEAARIAIIQNHDTITMADLKAGWREYQIAGGVDGEEEDDE